MVGTNTTVPASSRTSIHGAHYEALRKFNYETRARPGSAALMQARPGPGPQI